MTNRKILLFLLTALGTACGGADAEIAETSDALHGDRQLTGCYVPRSGGVRATAYTPTDALGRFTVVAEHRDWTTLSAAERRATRRWLWVAGEVKGTIDPATGLAAHVVTSRRRDGLLFTANDTFVPSATGCRLEGTQTLNYIAGAGRFGALTGGRIVMTGAINGCPDDPEAGRVDFAIATGQGELCFGTP